MNLEVKQYKNDFPSASTEPYMLGGVEKITDHTEYGDGYFAITIFDRRVFVLDRFEYVKDSETGKLFVNNGKWVAKSDKPIIFPEEEYVSIVREGKEVIVCTLRQKAMHVIGLNSGRTKGRLYTRHGKKYYKPYRNYFSGNDDDLDRLVDAGYMSFEESLVNDNPYRTYWFNRNGLNWLGEQLGIIIKDET